jgi:hypothetical protein
MDFFLSNMSDDDLTMENCPIPSKLIKLFPIFLFQQNKIVFFQFYAKMEISLSTNPCLTDCYLVDTVMTLPWLHVIWSKIT